MGGDEYRCGALSSAQRTRCQRHARRLDEDHPRSLNRLNGYAHAATVSQWPLRLRLHHCLVAFAPTEMSIRAMSARLGIGRRDGGRVLAVDVTTAAAHSALLAVMRLRGPCAPTHTCRAFRRATVRSRALVHPGAKAREESEPERGGSCAGCSEWKKPSREGNDEHDGRRQRMRRSFRSAGVHRRLRKHTIGDSAISGDARSGTTQQRVGAHRSRRQSGGPVRTCGPLVVDLSSRRGAEVGA